VGLEPSVAILSATANAQTSPASAPLHFPAHTTSLKIDYTAWSLSIPERVQFRYQLHGVDKDWQEAGNSRLAAYINLSPGTYWFEVEARNGDGKWSARAARQTLSIAPAYYQTIWFRASELMAAVVLIWLVMRMRIALVARQIEERMTERLRERDRIARELHDTLMQGFQSLMLRFQLAANAIPQGERSRLMMEDTLERADLVLVEGRERVRGLRSQEDDPTALADAILSVGKELHDTHTANFHLDVQGETRSLHPVVRDELLTIAKEAMTNAFRHARASEVICEILFARNHFLFVCRDNGIGIAPEFVSKTGRKGHWGIVGMGERAAKIGAAMKVSRGNEGGTRVEVKLGARTAYASPGKRRWWSLFSPRID
jgi:signal transduction histidine kinase